LQLIHKKLDEILIAITENRGAVERASVNTVTQEEFTAAMNEVIKLVNKNG
jgi:hypothetical protein